MSSPQHQQLAQSLLTQISEGQLAVGDRLPTEMELGEASGLARGTVRRALNHLEELGMISRRPGAGTIVIAPAPVDRYQPVAQSAADIANLTADTKIVRPDIRELVADNAVSSRIGVKKGTAWFLVQGVRVHRSGDDTPLCWSEHYLRGDTSRTDFLREFSPSRMSPGRRSSRPSTQTRCPRRWLKRWMPSPVVRHLSSSDAPRIKPANW